MNNVNEYLGQSKIMNNGLLATIIEYVNKSNITVSFPNGEKKKTNVYNFNVGQVACPGYHHTLLTKYRTRIGERVMQREGIYATLVEYKHNKNITVKFDTGEIRTGQEYHSFRIGRLLRKPRIKKPEKHFNVGDKVQTRNGTITILKRLDNNHFEIQLPNNSIREISRSVLRSSPDTIRTKREIKIGNQFTSSSGLVVSVVSLTNTKHIQVQFSDSTCISSSLKELSLGKFNHPSLKESGTYHSISFKKKIINKHIYYICSCSHCGFSGLLTATEVLSHASRCD